MGAKLFAGDSDVNRTKRLEEAFAFVGLDDALSGSAKVFVKPNFTFPRPLPGVTTSTEVLRDVLALLSETGAEVFVGESNGGYGSFLASEAFEGHGLYQLCRQTKAQPIDLSKQETRTYS